MPFVNELSFRIDANLAAPLSRFIVAPSFSHFDQAGGSRMVDVGDKVASDRTARARATVRLAPATLSAVRNAEIGKGNVLDVARLAGIMAAKQTDRLIPLCHTLPLEGVALQFDFLDDSRLQITADVRVTGKTGVEMEALTAVAIAALTVYDMCKSMERGICIESIRLEEKTGGQSGSYCRTQDEQASE